MPVPPLLPRDPQCRRRDRPLYAHAEAQRLHVPVTARTELVEQEVPRAIFKVTFQSYLSFWYLCGAPATPYNYI